MLVDLHLHSQHSDGTMTPRELALAGKERGYALLALTDHNTDDGWPEFSESCREVGLIPLRGMELDCLYDKWDLHILAYGYDPSPRLTALARQSYRLMLEMSDDLVRTLLPLYPQLDWAGWKSHPHHRARGGWKGLQYLQDMGVISALEDGIGFYAKHGCDYTKYPFPTAESVCAAIREAGGVPVLAHPGNWFSRFDKARLYTHFDELVRLGIGGIECHYPAHAPEMTGFCTDYCRQHGLLITTGSDWHGTFCSHRRGITYEMGQVAVRLEELFLGELTEVIK